MKTSARRLSMLIAVALLPGAASGQYNVGQALNGGVFTVAYMERHRVLPAEIPLDPVKPTPTVTPAQFLELGARVILNLAKSSYVAVPQSQWQMPAQPYPRMALAPEVYGQALERPEYLRFLRVLLEQTAPSGPLPSTFPLKGGQIRFVDAVFLVAHILRYQPIFNGLPRYFDLKIASPKGLFAWDVPPGLEEFVTGVDNFEDNVNSWGQDLNQYYQGSSMDFETYRLVSKKIGAETSAYRAGNAVYDMVKAQWDARPYGFGVFHTFGIAFDGFEEYRNMEGTSGVLYAPVIGLARAIGIPASIGARLHVDGRWINADIHCDYGIDYCMPDIPPEDWFEPAVGYPTRIPELSTQDPVLDAAEQLVEEAKVALRTGAPPAAFNAFYVNPYCEAVRPLLAYDLVDLSKVEATCAAPAAAMAAEAGFDAIVLTVKTNLGHYYYVCDEIVNEASLRVRLHYDALTPWIHAAREKGLRIYAGFNTLGDYYGIFYHDAAVAQDSGKWGQKFFRPVEGPRGLAYYRNIFNLSPCRDDVRQYLKKLLTGLVSNYDIDGVVLSQALIVENACADCKSGMFPLRADSPVIDKRNVLSGVVNDLASHMKALKPSLEVLYTTGPLRDAWEGESVLNAMPPPWPAPDVQYYYDPNPATVGSNLVDGIILNVPYMYWLTYNYQPSSSSNRYTFMKDLQAYRAATTIPVHLGALLCKEWQYPPELYRGLSGYCARSGFSGLVLFGESSAEGELGAAFVRQHEDKLKRINLRNQKSAPVLSPIGSRSMAAICTLSFPVEARDADGDAVSLRVSPLPSGATFVDKGDGTGAFRWIPTGAQMGTYTLTATARDGIFSTSETFKITVTPAIQFVRGDANLDGRFDMSDGLFILNALFLAGSPPIRCSDGADLNDDGAVEMSDGVYVFNNLFLGGPPPVQPYPAKGIDPKPDELPCDCP